MLCLRKPVLNGREREKKAKTEKRQLRFHRRRGETVRGRHRGHKGKLPQTSRGGNVAIWNGTAIPNFTPIEGKEYLRDGGGGMSGHQRLQTPTPPADVALPLYDEVKAAMPAEEFAHSGISKIK